MHTTLLLEDGLLYEDCEGIWGTPGYYKHQLRGFCKHQLRVVNSG